MEYPQKVVSMQSVKYISRILLVVGSIAFLRIANALASSGDEQTIAISQWSVDGLGQSGYVATIVLILLILSLLALVWVNRTPGSGLVRSEVAGASNLFLGVKFEKLAPTASDRKNVETTRVGEDLPMRPSNAGVSAEELAYLRELGLTEALLVSPTRLEKNDHVLLHLGSLPDYPKEFSDVRGVVSASKSLGGEPENFLVRILFENTSRPVDSDLPNYLRLLTANRQSSLHRA
jgi:hypothetical protein